MRNKIIIFLSFLVGFTSLFLFLNINHLREHNSSLMNSVNYENNQNGATKIVETKYDGATVATKVYDDVKAAVVTIKADNEATSAYSFANEGSGFVYKIADGYAYVLTNAHVVSDNPDIEVVSYDGKTEKASLIKESQIDDLAVLKVKSKYLKKSLVLAKQNVTAAQPVLVVGSPLGLNYASSMTSGIVSSPKRIINNMGKDIELIQTDAAINSGNSGGPLLNLKGQVIGITSMKLTSQVSNENIEGMGFAISNKIIKEFIDSI